jgi:hypothetical protein
MLGGSLASSTSRAKLKLLTEGDLAGRVEADDVENILANIDADGGDGLRRPVVLARHGLLLLIEAVGLQANPPF